MYHGTRDHLNLKHDYLFCHLYVLWEAGLCWHIVETLLADTCDIQGQKDLQPWNRTIFKFVMHCVWKYCIIWRTLWYMFRILYSSFYSEGIKEYLGCTSSCWRKKEEYTGMSYRLINQQQGKKAIYLCKYPISVTVIWLAHPKYALGSECNSNLIHHFQAWTLACY